MIELNVAVADVSGTVDTIEKMVVDGDVKKCSTSGKS
jgi:hypothetical protein